MGDVHERAPNPLRDEVVALRLLSPDDVPTFAEGLRDPAVAPFAYGDKLRADIAEVREYIAECPATGATDDAILFAVVNTADRAFLGQAMLFHIDSEARSAELRFWLSPTARGRGPRPAPSG